MEFSENHEPWRSIPSWVQFLIRLGYEWPRSSERLRRIALISMPCDSAAAGLITLGAMVRDLTDSHANDVEGHYEKLLGYAQQYVQHCVRCDIPCQPHLKHCGFARQATGHLRSPLLPRTTVVISELTDFTNRQIKWVQRDGRQNSCLVSPSPEHAKNYHIEDEAPAQWNQPNGGLSPDGYEKIIENLQIIPSLLHQSYSGLCFAGRSTGEAASYEICSRIRFRKSEIEYGLADLLTVHGWSNATVSRVALFTPRTERLDRNNAAPNLVIADGDGSFLKVLDQPEFRRSDIIGVIHRNVDRDRLEALGAKMVPNQWFTADTDRLCELPSQPRGISVAILKERNP